MGLCAYRWQCEANNSDPLNQLSFSAAHLFSKRIGEQARPARDRQSEPIKGLQNIGVQIASTAVAKLICGHAGQRHCEQQCIKRRMDSFSSDAENCRFPRRGHRGATGETEDQPEDDKNENGDAEKRVNIGACHLIYGRCAGTLDTPVLFAHAIQKQEVE